MTKNLSSGQKSGHKVVWTASVALALVGIAAAFAVTREFGPGVSPDSAAYLSAAQNLASGNGLTLFDGSALTSWPPLYPLVLAACDLLADNLLMSVLWLHSVILTVAVVATSLLIYDLTRNTVLSVLAGAVMVISTPVFVVTVFVWSDAAFVLLMLLSVHAIYRYLLSNNRTSFIALVLLLAASCLVRYNGVILIASAGTVILLFAEGRPLHRLLRASSFVALACLPLVFWLIRNWLLTGHPTGVRPPSETAFTEVISQAITTITSWAIPEQISPYLRVPLVAVGIALLLFLTLRSGDKRRLHAPFRGVAVYCWLSAFFNITLTIAMASAYSLDQVNSRYLLPAYVLAILIVALAYHCLIELVVEKAPKKKAALWVVGTALLCTCLVPLYRTGEFVLTSIHEGVGVFASPKWVQSNVLQSLSTVPEDAVLVSNAPDFLWVYAARPAYYSPRHVEAWRKVPALTDTASNTYLVWFDDHFLRRGYSLSEVESIVPVSKYASFEGGTIFSVDLSKHSAKAKAVSSD